MNLKSVWLLSQAAGQHMVPRRRGKIINFCSLLTYQVSTVATVDRNFPLRNPIPAPLPAGAPILSSSTPSSFTTCADDNPYCTSTSLPLLPFLATV